MSAHPTRGLRPLPPLLVLFPLLAHSKVQGCGRSTGRSPRDARRSPRRGRSCLLYTSDAADDTPC
eukprot:8013939-Pyramimonas_sp.AAC.1